MATYVKTPANDLVLIFSPAEAKALANLASDRAVDMLQRAEGEGPVISEGRKYDINAAARAWKALESASLA